MEKFNLPMIAAAVGFGLLAGFALGLPALPIVLGAVGAEIAMQALA